MKNNSRVFASREDLIAAEYADASQGDLAAALSFNKAYMKYINSLTLAQFCKLPVGTDYVKRIAAARKVSKSRHVWALADAASVALETCLPVAPWIYSLGLF